MTTQFVALYVLTISDKPGSDTETFGDFIRKIRLGRNHTQPAVAAAVGIDSTLLSKLENGNRFPTQGQISKLARFFNVPEAELKARVIADKISAEYDDKVATLRAAHILKDRAAASKSA